MCKVLYDRHALISRKVNALPRFEFNRHSIVKIDVPLPHIRMTLFKKRKPLLLFLP